MEIKEKLRLLIREFGPTQKEFAALIGTTQPSVANWIAKNEVPNGGLLKIITHCEGVTYEWLTGEDEEWRSDAPLRRPRSFRGRMSDTYLTSSKNRPTRYYPGVNASCGQKEQNTDDLSTEEILIPGMNNDAWINAEGYSMTPTIQPGDKVGLRLVEDKMSIRPGYIYMIETSNGERLLKRISQLDPKSEYLTLVSDNKENYPPFDIEKASIIRIYRATALIRSLL